ncbi:transmembrane and coiled-coil domain-containing protein 5A isoform X2 [Macrotis lagotis]|uniref:transmembrane and coiled-coil domain-containing protein 5A isoform X2 n=1 Tax=Macrotis lagotis TaxID=92651 RepID=UPI003D684760
MESIMEEEEQIPLNNESSKRMEIIRLEQSKKNLNSLNMDLEKDLHRIDEANQSLLLKIQKEEIENRRLESELAQLESLAEERERKELENSLSEKEQDLKELEQETSKLEKVNEALTHGIRTLQNQLSGKSHASKALVAQEEVILESPEVLKTKIQQTEACLAEKEKELFKVLVEYETMKHLYETQAYCIKKYQEVLRKMAEEIETRFLEREVSKALSAQPTRPGLLLVDDIQNDAEKISIGKKRNYFWYKCFGFFFIIILLMTKLQSFLVFHINYVNSDVIMNALPKMMSRFTLHRLRCFLQPFLYLEADDVLPH